MDSSQITISIIIPTYNSALHIERTLKSVLAQTFIQSHRDWELLIIDDGSTDNTVSILTPYLNLDSLKNRIKYIKNEQNIGISKTRNRGLTEAHGQYIAMIDSDDLWLDPKKLAQQVEFLDSHPDHAAVGTWMIQIDEHDRPLDTPTSGKIAFAQQDTDIRASILYRNHIAQSSVLFRKNTLRYDESLATLEDLDLWLRMGIQKDAPNKLASLPIYALGYRVHPGGITKRRKLRGYINKIKIIMQYRHSYRFSWIELFRGVERVIRN